MTREEASNILDDYDVNFDGHTAEEIAEAFEVAFRALEQEPCDNAVSRQAVLDKKELIELEDGQSFYCISPEDVETLPPVTPQPKTGHWIHFASSDDCSECGWSTGKYISPSKYCPNCGCRMVEPQESEVQE